MNATLHPARGPASPVVREAVLAAGAAAAVSALLVWAAPPGVDVAAHIYQRTLFLQHGFELWNNFWYAGRYSFVTYSFLYYPLAAAVGIRLLAVMTVAAASLAFSVIVWREWGSRALWSSRTFPVVWAGIVLSAAFPFALGAALALLALWAAQARRLRRFAPLALLTLAASPVAFLLLALVLAGVGVSRHTERRVLVGIGLVVGSLGFVELVLWRLFPSAGRYPFSGEELAAALVFCGIATALTWRNERVRVLRFVFPVYAAACFASYVVPSGLGDNIARLRFLAIPLAILVLALRDWRPLPVCVLALALATFWNVTPLAFNLAQAASDTASKASYWAPAVRYLKAHLSPNYRVEAVDTVGHWDAVYLPEAGIPLARGWFRQDDFPENAVLYGRPGPKAYDSWLHRLGIGYVVLTSAPPDYSAAAEARLVAGGLSSLRLVFRTASLSIYAVRSPRPLITGPGSAHVTSFTRGGMTATVARAGTYRVAVHASPYWRLSPGCVTAGEDGMILLHVPTAGTVTLAFDLSAAGALRAITGGGGDTCS